MNSIKEHVFKNVLQVAVVVENLDESMKNYWEIYGIGPWKIYTFDKSTVKEMIIRDKYVNYEMKLALCDIGNVQWELIEPLDDKSIYYEFLKKHGHGLHHVAFAVDNYEKTINHFKQKNIGVLQGGLWNGLKYTYLDSEASLSTIAEIYQISKDFEWPQPQAIYP